MKIRNISGSSKIGTVPRKIRTVGAALNLKRTNSLDYFRYASVSKLSKHRCRLCGTPIRSHSIRRVVLCPVCNAENELK